MSEQTNQTQEPLTFKSEADKLEAMEQFQQKSLNHEISDEDFESELDRLDSAQIVEDLNENVQETNPTLDNQAQPPENTVTDAQPQVTPDSNDIVLGDHSKELFESFKSLSPDMIPDESYFDPVTKRQKRYITHKDAKSLFSSYSTRYCS